jgi:hypothetical protein
MANWYGSTRTNFFKVKDIKMFMDKVSSLSSEIGFQAHPSAEGFIFLYGKNESGDFPMIENPETGEYEAVDLVEIVSPHLEGDQVCVVQMVGSEKLRYLTGHAYAFNAKGEVCVVSIDDIYEKAALKFGVALSQIAQATYQTLPAVPKVKPSSSGLSQ